MAISRKSLLGLFTYQYESDSSGSYIEVESAYFLKDFGPWKAGQAVEYLGVNFEECIVYEFDGIDSERRIHEASFSVVPKP